MHGAAAHWSGERGREGGRGMEAKDDLCEILGLARSAWIYPLCVANTID